MPAAPTANRRPGEASSVAAVNEVRLRELVECHFASVWRFVRRLGVSHGDVDDAMQEVILVIARRLDDIVPGRERAFMMSTAYRVASDMRRARLRRAETDAEDTEAFADPAPGAHDLLEQRQARQLLDQVLDSLELELRAVFVLYELDGLTMAEIAEALELAPGTVASRLRRARQQFEARVARLEKSLRNTGGGS